MATLAVIGLVALYLYTKREVPLLEPQESRLPLQQVTDVRRWRHDGTQPVSERIGNYEPAVEWPEVEKLL